MQGVVGLGLGERRASGLQEDLSQVAGVQRIERTDDREPAHELLAQAVAHEVIGGHVLGDEPLGCDLPQRPRGSEAEARPFLQASLDDAVDALERPRRDDEQAPRVEAMGLVVPMNRYVRPVEERE